MTRTTRTFLIGLSLLTVALAGCTNTPTPAVQNTTSPQRLQAQENHTHPQLQDRINKLSDAITELQQRVEEQGRQIAELEQRVRSLRENVTSPRPSEAPASQEADTWTPTHQTNGTIENVTVWIDEAYDRGGRCYQRLGETCWNVILNITNNESDPIEVGPRKWTVHLNDTDEEGEATREPTLYSGERTVLPNKTEPVGLTFSVPKDRHLVNITFEPMFTDKTLTVALRPS